MGRFGSYCSYKPTCMALPRIYGDAQSGHEQLDYVGLINMNGRLYDPALGRMLSVDNYVVGASGTQAYNRYTYAFNNPMVYNDPDGNCPICIGFMIGIFAGTIQNLIQGNVPNNMWEFLKLGVIGGISAGVGSLVSTATIAWGTVGSGIASGAVSGFVGGGLNAALSVGNFWRDGMNGAIWGGVIGGISGLLFRGQPRSQIANESEINNLSGYSIEATCENVQKFSDEYFPNMSKEFGVKFEVAGPNNLPRGFEFDSKTQLLVRVRDRMFVNGVQQPEFFGRSKIFLAPGRFINNRLLFRTMGHELIHAWHDKITPFYNRLGEGYLDLTEASAHSWSYTMGVKFRYDFFGDSFGNFAKYFSQLSINQVKQYYSTYHWSNHSGFARFIRQIYK